MTTKDLLDTENMMPELVEQMLDMAQKAEEPGGSGIGVVDTGKDTGVPIIGHSLLSAGYTYMWNTKTGQQGLTNNNMAKTQLDKRFPDGTRVWTFTQPNFKPTRGVYLCDLHEDAEHRQYYNTLGMRTCPKSNLMNKYEVTRHMLKSHKVETRTIKEERDREEREADRAWQKQVTELALGRMPQTPVQDATVEAEVPVEPVKPKRVYPPVTKTCAFCDFTITSKAAIAATNKLDKHVRQEHPDE